MVEGPDLDLDPAVQADNPDDYENPSPTRSRAPTPTPTPAAQLQSATQFAAFHSTR